MKNLIFHADIPLLFVLLISHVLEPVHKTKQLELKKKGGRIGKCLENNEMFVMTTRAFCGANKPLSVLAVLVLSFLELSSRDFPSQSPETNILQKGRS